MFMHKRETRLDLMGKQPSATRPVIIITCAILLGSIAAVAIGLEWQYHRFRVRIHDILGPALNVETRLAALPAILDFVYYSRHAESALTELGDSVVAYYSGRANCAPLQALLPRSPSQTASDSHAACPSLVDNDLVLSTYADPHLLSGAPIRTMINDQDTARVINVTHYLVQDAFDSLLSPAPSTPFSALLDRASSIADLLARCYSLFPNKSASSRASDTVVWGDHDASLLTPGMPNGLVAFLHCSLILPPSTFPDTMALDKCLANRGTRMRDERDSRLLPHAAARSDPSLQPRFESAATALEGADTLPHIFLAYPASRLPHDFDCSQRPWYLGAMKSRGSYWTQSYPDAATGIPVITLAQPLFLPGGRDPIGVIGVDYFTSELVQYPKPGYGYFLNFLIMLVLTFSLVTIVASSSRQRFDPLIYAFVTLLFYYVYRVWLWLFPVTSPTGMTAVTFVDLLLSILVSILFLGAGIAVFREFKHNPFKAPRPRKPSFLHDTIEKIVPQSKTNFLYVLARATLLTVLAYALQVFIAPFVHPGGGEYFLMAVDVLLAVVALLIFGHDFAVWTKVYYSVWVSVVCYCAFSVYALIQPLVAFGQTPGFLAAVAVAKIGALGLVVATVYGWTQHNNFERIRGTGSRAIMLERLGTPRRFIIMSGNIDKRRILFVDRSTLVALGWEEKVLPDGARGRRAERGDDVTGREEVSSEDMIVHDLGMEVYRSNHPIAGWDVSEFGNDLYQPSDDRIRLPEMFAPGYFTELTTKLFQGNPAVLVWKDLDDRVTRRYTAIRMIRDTDSALNSKKGHPHEIRILSLTAWQDRDVPISEPSYSSELATDSDWYFILFAESKRVGSKLSAQQTG